MKPRTFVEKIADNFYLLRIDDEEVKYFEAVWRIPEKITYNTYLLLGDGECVLFDGWKEDYSEDFVNAVAKIIDPKEITHIVLHHMEPDHSGSLPGLLEANGFKAEVMGHPMVRTLVEAFYGIKPKFKPVKDGEKTSIAGERLQFFHTPWLHWPETMMTYLADRGVLVTGDAFGGFSAPETLFDDDEEVVREYIPSVRRYVASIIGYYRRYISRNIEKLEKLGLEFKLIAPAHGIIWKNHPRKIIEYYLKLAEGVPEEGKISVIYASMYGASKFAASVAVEELKKRGKRPVVYGFTDQEQPSITSVLGDAFDSEAIILASPTYEADVFPTISYIADLIMKKVPQNKPVLILSSYGWAGVAGKKLAERFKEAGFEIVEVVEFRGRLRDEEKERILNAVEKFLAFLSST